MRPAPLFYLGAPAPGWLGTAGVPLFVADTRLRRYKRLPRAAARWALDSGGFTQLQKHGTWTVTAAEYVARVRRYRDEIGALDWAAPQDWMCERAIIDGGWWGGQYFAGTHLSVAEHQRRTVLNFAQLRDLAPDLPWRAAVQGDGPDAYRRCVDLYWTLARIDLTAEPMVAVGSVCRRQSTPQAGRILRALHSCGLHRLHGFGFKLQGLAHHGHLLASADSMAWSITARRLQRPALPQCHGRHRNCASCLDYALHWRDTALAAACGHLTRPSQLTLWPDEEAA